jgi:hypothetical protein
MTIQEISLDQISQIYVGKDRNCRCGCGGTYIATTFMESPRTDIIDNIRAQKNLTRAKKLALRKDVLVEYGDNHINIGYGNNRAITIYTDEVKK